MKRCSFFSLFLCCLFCVNPLLPIGSGKNDASWLYRNVGKPITNFLHDALNDKSKEVQTTTGAIIGYYTLTFLINLGLGTILHKKNDITTNGGVLGIALATNLIIGGLGEFYGNENNPLTIQMLLKAYLNWNKVPGLLFNGKAFTGFALLGLSTGFLSRIWLQNIHRQLRWPAINMNNIISAAQLRS
ncbi:MAG: hypothetical protein JW725_01240 [Candidatus Babeliaceae bacterium]|nr:hypothetical protein [Candidatus Babeliaceae bacterium]